jgi:putative CRISPR-associated protein (TIGR02620 family)
MYRIRFQNLTTKDKGPARSSIACPYCGLVFDRRVEYEYDSKHPSQGTPSRSGGVWYPLDQLRIHVINEHDHGCATHTQFNRVWPLIKAGHPIKYGWVIITRHQGLVEWLRRKGIKGEVIAHATEDDVRGKDVIGNLPLHLANVALSVTVVDMPNLPPELRGQDLSPEQMDEAGATLRRYVVVGEPDTLDPIAVGKDVLTGFGYYVDIGSFGYDSIHIAVYDDDGERVYEDYCGR